MEEWKKNSRKWKAYQVALYTHFPVILTGLVGFGFGWSSAATVVLGALGSLVALTAAYTGLNVMQKGIEHERFSSASRS